MPKLYTVSKGDLCVILEFIGNTINLISTTKLFKILSNKLLDVETYPFGQSMTAMQKWYFVTKIVLT